MDQDKDSTGTYPVVLLFGIQVHMHYYRDKGKEYS